VNETARARAFLALPLGAELGESVSAAVREALGGAAGRDWKLPQPAGLHLTLFFLGPRPRAWLAELAGALGPALAACPPPRLALGGVGGFPNLDGPRVLWVGVEEREAPGRLAGIRAALHAALQRAGVDTRAEEGPFRAHVTVARPRADRVRVPEAFLRLRWAEPFAAEAALLFESVPAAGGNLYEPLARLPFLARA